jgi:hypothetical protein
MQPRLESMNSAERDGMAWWNALQPFERAYWLRTAGSAVPAEAWEAHRRWASRTASELARGAASPDIALSEPVKDTMARVLAVARLRRQLGSEGAFNEAEIAAWSDVLALRYLQACATLNALEQFANTVIGWHDALWRGEAGPVRDALRAANPLEDRAA